MANNPKNRKKVEKIAGINAGKNQFAGYNKSKYFEEKDRKAAEFLKKHPIPENLLK